MQLWFQQGIQKNNSQHSKPPATGLHAGGLVLAGFLVAFALMALEAGRVHASDELLRELGRDPAAVLSKVKLAQAKTTESQRRAELHLLASEANTLLVLGTEALAEAEAGLAILSEEPGDRADKSADKKTSGASAELPRVKALRLRLLLARAMATDLIGQSGRALSSVNQVIEALADWHDPQLMAEALHSRGVIYSTLLDQPAALADLQRAYALASEDHPRLARGDVAGSIANLYGWQNDGENAVRYYQEAISYFQRTQADVKLSISVYGLGTLYRDQQEWPQARRYFGWSLELSTQRKDEQGVAYAQQQLANIAIETGQLDQARALLDLAQPLFERAADHPMAINTLISRSDLALARKQYTEALQWLSDAEVYAKREKLLWLEPPIWERRSQLYAEQKNFEQAYNAHRMFYQQMNAALKHESDNRVQELRVRFDSERQEQQNLMLRQQNELQQAALAQQRQQLWLYVAVALLSLLSTLFLLYAIYKGKQVRQKLDALAHTDELTGLPNRRYVMQVVQQEVDRSRRYGLPLSLAVLDLDQFKAINDKFGHSMGDEVLRRFATLCRQTLRQTDVMGRIGGEEFVLVLPHTQLALATQILDRLRQDFRQLDWSMMANKHQPTVSIGATTLSEADSGLADLLRRADDALYQAKQTGRDRVAVREHAQGPAVGSRLGEGLQQYEKY